MVRSRVPIIVKCRSQKLPSFGLPRTSKKPALHVGPEFVPLALGSGRPKVSHLSLTKSLPHFFHVSRSADNRHHLKPWWSCNLQFQSFGRPHSFLKPVSDTDLYLIRSCRKWSEERRAACQAHEWYILKAVSATSSTFHFCKVILIWCVSLMQNWLHCSSGFARRPHMCLRHRNWKAWICINSCFVIVQQPHPHRSVPPSPAISALDLSKVPSFCTIAPLKTSKPAVPRESCVSTSHDFGCSCRA